MFCKHANYFFNNYAPLRKEESKLSITYGYSDFYSYLVPTTKGMLSFLGGEVNNWQGLQILDTACGNGSLAQGLVDMGARVTAMECSPVVLAQATEFSRRSGSPRKPYYISGDLQRLPGEAGTFQMVLCLNNAVSALSNADAYRDFFRQAASLLVPEGRLVIQMLNYNRVVDKGDYSLNSIEEPEKGILIQRWFEDGSDGMLDLVSRVRILRLDAFEFSNHRSRVYPICQDELREILSETGFAPLFFFSDVLRTEWVADCYSTLLMAVRK